VVAPAGLRERKKEKTREALVRAALRLFAKRGFDHVTVEDIATACEVSPRTFFRYFAAKEDVLFADGDAYRVRLLAALDEQPPDRSPVDALQAAMHELAAAYVEQRDTIRRRHRVVQSTPSLRTRAAERQQRWEADLVDHLRRSPGAADVRDLDLRLIVAATTAALRVAVEAWIEADDAGDLPTIVDDVFQQLRAGLASTA
jgi:AcrR family transcriptional regulator